MTTIYFVRHCESTGNVQRRMQGRTDCDISEHGAQQLEHLKKRMANVKIDKIYSSPLQRARKTAEAVRGKRRHKINIVDDLQEISFGSWEDLTWEQLYQKFPDEVGKWEQAPYEVRFEGGETFGDVEERVIKVIEAIVKKHRRKTIVLASHGTPIRLFARYVTDSDKNLSTINWAKNTSVTTIEVEDDGTMRLVEYGNVDHLPIELVKEVAVVNKDEISK